MMLLNQHKEIINNQHVDVSLPTFNCRICGSKVSSQHYKVREMMFETRKTYLYSQCNDCGVVQIDNPIKEASLLYPQNYYSFSVTKRLTFLKKIRNYLFTKSVAVELGHFNILGFISRRFKVSYEAKSLKNKITKGDKILDVGCGEGELIIALRKIGYKNVSGIDPYIEKDIENEHIVIHKKFLHELPTTNHYDVIMLHHSFEHMEDPLEALESLYKILNKEGKLIIRIPVSDSYAFEKYKQNWFQLDAPRHFFLHTNKSILHLASKVGFIIKEIINDSLISQFIISEQYEKGIPLNSSDSYFTSIYRRLNPFIKRKQYFSTEVLENFRMETERLNKLGKGDQRIFILAKA